MARIRIGGKDRLLEANHIVSVPPAQQQSWSGPYIMAGFNQDRPFNDRFHANTWYSVESSSVGVPPFRNSQDLGLDYPPGRVFYGLTGSGEEGSIYDPATSSWYRDVAAVPGVTGGGLGGGLPPGIGSGGGSGVPSVHKYIEFSVAADGDNFFTAKTPDESASGRNQNPHPGISIINPDDGDRIYSGLSPKDLDLDDYRSKGWKGLDKFFIAWQGTNGALADEELSDAMDRAEGGDATARKALSRVGVSLADGGGSGGGNLLEDIGKLLGGR